MSHRLKNLNQKYYIALGIGIALIFLINFLLINFIIFSLPGAIVALFFLIFALAKIVSKTFATNHYETIIKLLIGAIIANSISLIINIGALFSSINMIIVIVVCVVVLRYTLTVKKREEAKPQEEISPQQKIAQREYNMLIIKFVVGGGLIVIGIVGAIYSATGVGGMGVDITHPSGSGYLLLGILVGPPIIVFIVPGYFLVRSAYRKSKH